MAGNKAARRANAVGAAIRLFGDIPLITDKTEMITPQRAMEMLEKNKNNRPINWKKVEEYADLMRQGKFKVHSQGIILDPHGNILTGQKRLWAIIYADVPVPMRISYGCPSDTANLLDRGTPQSARDLASRKTEKKHTPTEASIARTVCVLNGSLRPSTDMIAEAIIENTEKSSILICENKGLKKTKSVLMIMGAICSVSDSSLMVRRLSKKVPILTERLEKELGSTPAEKCWNKGAAFTMAMENARRIANSAKTEKD